MKKPINNPALQTWVGLNEALLSMEDETELARLLKEELRGRCRQAFAKRIQSRLNRVRADREQTELLEKLR